MRTDAKLKEVCESLRQSCGDLHAAARRTGVSLDFLANWIKDDKEAAAEIEDAQRIGYMGLESALINRAVNGVQKAVYHKGEVVGYDTVYSDGLLAKAVEARIPAYNKKEASNATFNGPTQINIMPRAENFDQWLEMKKSTLDARKEQKALEAPQVKLPDILVGDYVDLTEKPLAGLAGLL